MLLQLQKAYKSVCTAVRVGLLCTPALLSACALGASTQRLPPEQLSASLRGEENIVYPSDAGVINVKEAPYNAKGDGTTDDTLAIQAALDDAKADPNERGIKEGNIVYFPNGVYLLSDTVGLGEDRLQAKRVRLQGQSEVGTILKLDNSSSGFGNSSMPKAVVSFFSGRSSNAGFLNGMRNITVEVGPGNPGAIALEFLTNNGGGVRDVTLTGDGHTGLDLTRRRGGIGYLKNVTIHGFQYGIHAAFSPSNYVLEYIYLSGQDVAGILNEDRKSLSIRKLFSDNRVPAIVNADSGAHIVILDSELKGGSRDNAAIDNRQGVLFARNITHSGYRAAISDQGKLRPGNFAKREYISGKKVYTLFEEQKPKSLSLPIKDTPEVPWDDLSEWANVQDFGATPGDTVDDTDAIQKAIDSGKTTVYFPTGFYQISNTIHIRGDVTRIAGLGSVIEVIDGSPLETQESPALTALRFEDGAPDEVVIQELILNELILDQRPYAPFLWLEHAANRTLILDEVGSRFVRAYKSTGDGDVFMEGSGEANLGGGLGSYTGENNPFADGSPIYEFNGQNAWIRGFNPEDYRQMAVNDGGNLWILGFKWEGGFNGGYLETKDGGRTEVLGGILNSVLPPDDPSTPTGPAFIVTNASLSVTATEFSRSADKHYDVLVRETRGGETRELLRSDLPKIPGANDGTGVAIPLFSGYE